MDKTGPHVDLMIVEDSDLVVQRLKEILSEINQIRCVAVASTYDEAIEQFYAFKPVIVLLDISLSRVNGSSFNSKNGILVLREIKKLRPSTVVIMLTTFSGNYYRKTCFDIGANYFLDKSTEFERIPEILNSCIK
jgi:DNA-binding NarL/FixJ family response regulator